MVDRLTPEQRHCLMSKIRGKNTLPERTVRKLVFALGYRFRLHRKDLPGKPDIVLPKLKKVIFVHGCFWHAHVCKALPKSNKKFWEEKFRANKSRDKKNLSDLKKLGWYPIVIWECMTRDPSMHIRLKKRLSKFLAEDVKQN